jgi:transaldolase
VLGSRALIRRIADRTVTGLVFDTAHYIRVIRSTGSYDGLIAGSLKENTLGEELLFRLAVEDIRRAADLLRHIYEESDGSDGWASMDVSPLTVHDAASCAAAAKCIYDRVFRPNVFIRIPGTPEALPAIEATTFLGVPVHVTLLFSCEQYLAAALAYIRGLERRIAAGSQSDVRSAASVTVALPDAADRDSMTPELRGRLCSGMSERIDMAHRKLLSSRRWRYVSDSGAAPQTLCWDGPLEKGDCTARHWVTTALSLSDLVQAPAGSGADSAGGRPADGNVPEPALERAGRAEAELQQAADRLQGEAFCAEVRAWIDLLSALATKSAALATSAIAPPAGTSPEDIVRTKGSI